MNNYSLVRWLSCFGGLLQISWFSMDDFIYTLTQEMA
jgi:hypothetical protein